MRVIFLFVFPLAPTDDLVVRWSVLTEACTFTLQLTCAVRLKENVIVMLVLSENLKLYGVEKRVSGGERGWGVVVTVEP